MRNARNLGGGVGNGLRWLRRGWVRWGEAPARTSGYQSVLSLRGASLGAHGVMPAAVPSIRGKALCGVGAGLLSWFVPLALAGEVTAQARAEQDAALAAAGGKVPRRRVRVLPPQVALYFTLALCLSASLPYCEV